MLDFTFKVGMLFFTFGIMYQLGRILEVLEQLL
jgi:hypothetical protein